jgi:hypothetical protein
MLPLQIEDRTQKHKIQAQKTNKDERIGSSTTPLATALYVFPSTNVTSAVLAPSIA